MADVRNEVPADLLEAADGGEVVHRQHRAAVGEWACDERDGAIIDRHLTRFDHLTGQRQLQCVAQLRVVWQPIDRKWHFTIDAGQDTANIVDSHHLPARIDGDRALRERIEQLGQQRFLGLQRRQSGAKLFGEPMNRPREIPDFAWRRDSRPAREVTRGQRLCDIAQFADRLRDRAGEKPAEDGDRKDRTDADLQDVEARARKRSRPPFACAPSTRETPSGIRTATYNSSSPADADTRRAWPEPVASASRTSGRLRWFSSALNRAPSNSESPSTTPGSINQGDTMAGGATRVVGNRVRGGECLPLRSEQSRFALELRHLIVGRCARTAVGPARRSPPPAAVKRRGRGRAGDGW